MKLAGILDPAHFLAYPFPISMPLLLDRDKGSNLHHT